MKKAKAAASRVTKRIPVMNVLDMAPAAEGLVLRNRGVCTGLQEVINDLQGFVDLVGNNLAMKSVEIVLVKAEPAEAGQQL